MPCAHDERSRQKSACSMHALREKSPFVHWKLSLGELDEKNLSFPVFGITLFPNRPVGEDWASN